MLLIKQIYFYCIILSIISLQYDFFFVIWIQIIFNNCIWYSRRTLCIGQWYIIIYECTIYLKFIFKNLRVHAKTVISMIFQWKQVRYFGFHYDRRNDCYLSNCTQLICRTLSRVWHTLDQRDSRVVTTK